MFVWPLCLSTTAVGPIANLRVLSSPLVPVGTRNIGPAPQTIDLVWTGERKNAFRRIAPTGLGCSAIKVLLIDDWDCCTAEQIPVL